MLSFCLKCRKNRKCKNPKDLRAKKNWMKFIKCKKAVDY